jgi:DNA (cytosine-5)-methyltransferase 1
MTTGSESLFAETLRCHKVGLFAAQDLEHADVRDACGFRDGAQAVPLVSELLRDGSAPLGDALHRCEAHLLGVGDGLSQRVHGVRGAGVIQGNRDALLAGFVAESVVGDGLITESAVRGHNGNNSYRAGFVKPRLLDLFCCRGGGAMGYHRAGWEVVGVDVEPQPDYPFEFIQADALDLLKYPYHYTQGMGFDAIHASPPCQAFTVYGNNRAHVRDDHPNLIPGTRELLRASRLPYVIENVEGAKAELRDPVRICGTGLGVRVRRHRLFEANWPIEGVACDHGRFTDRPFPGSSNRPNGRTVMNVGEYRVPLATQREVMEMPWSDLYGISQAIPPAYTQYIGRQLLALVVSQGAQS